jgi:hypothetical protein
MVRERWITITVPPKHCDNCGTKIRHVRRTSWRNGYMYCPKGCLNWYGKGVKKDIRVA